MSYKKVKFISNIVIVLVIIAVFIVGFLPNNAITISSKDGYRAIYNGNRNSSNVALMINVYENGDIVKSMLNVLNEKQVKATFFVGGCWADDNQEILKLIIASGHELGNHGYFHKDHKKLSEQYN